MTYCCGILVRDGLVMIADTRTNAGLDNISTFRKLHIYSMVGVSKDSQSLQNALICVWFRVLWYASFSREEGYL